MASPIRTFIAVKIPATDALKETVSQLGAMGRAVKVVAVDRLHVTLKFLGDTDPDLVGEIGGIVQSASVGKSPFKLRLHGLGAFPHLGRPSVVWAGLENAETLALMAETLEEKLKPLGFAPERREFQPHLTLARIKAKPPEELKALVAQHESTEFGDATVRSVEFIQSELQPDGPRYTVLTSAALATN